MINKEKKMINMAEAKLLFKSGSLKDPRIIIEPISKGWIILFAKKEGKTWVNDNYRSQRGKVIRHLKI